MYNADLFKALIETVVDGILVIDQCGKILLVNPAANTLFGYEPGELAGQPVHRLMSAEHARRHDGYLKNYALTGKASIIGVGREITGLRKDGSLFPARLAVSEVKCQDSSLYTGVIHDLTSEKAAEDKLRSRADELEAIVQERTGFLQNIVHTLEKAKEEMKNSLVKEKQVNQLKTRFVTMASHEFRTPLSSIQLSASLIEHYYDQLDREKVFAHLDKIKSGVSGLTAILNDFLSVERIESGKIEPNFKEFNLRVLCADIRDAMAVQLKSGQRLDFAYKGTAEMVTLDTNMLQHALVNLISNSIKYSTNTGHIQLTAITDRARVAITVKDNGIGIPLADQPHLFEPFFRANNTGEIQGTGLGLSIVKRYTELMNGTVSFESRPGKGTLVTLHFPANLCRPE